MLRKVMLWLMTALLAVRLPALVYAIVIDPARFPVAVYVITGSILFYSFLLIVLQLFHIPLTRRKLVIFFIISALASVLNMAIIKLLARVEVVPLDLLVIGTLADVFFAAVFTVMTMQERRYVLTRSR